MQAFAINERTVQVQVDHLLVSYRWGHEAWQQVRLNQELKPLEVLQLFETMPAPVRALGPDAIVVYLEHAGHPVAVKALQTVPEHVKHFGIRGMRAHVLDMLDPVHLVEPHLLEQGL